MSKNNFKFIRVKSDYINSLLRYDNKIQYNDNLLGKENKPFLGVLFDVKGKTITFHYLLLIKRKN